MNFSFSPEQQKEIQEILEMQNLLTNINQENLNNTFNYFSKSVYLSSQSKFRDLVRNILTWSTYHPTNVYLYSDLLLLLFSNIPMIHEIAGAIIVSESVHFIFKNRLHPVECSALHILFQSYKREIVDAHTIVDAIKLVYYQKRQYKTHISAFFMFFAPEVEQLNNDLFVEILKFMKMNLCRKNVDPIVQYFDYYSHNNWENLKKFRQFIYGNDMTLKMLLEDDVDMLKKLCSHPDFDINQILENQPHLSPFYFLSNSPSLVAAAAALNAIKCMNYLIFMGVNLEQKSDRQSFGSYATISGNIEILKIAEQANCNFDGALQMAATFHYDDIFYYLHETGFPDLTAGSDNNKFVLSQVGSSNNVSILLYCLQQGLDLNTIDGKNESFLDRASYFGNKEVIKIALMLPYTNINLHSNTPPLCAAAYNGHFEILKLYLERQDIDLEITNNKNSTPLSLTIRSSHYSSFRMLLDLNPNLLSHEDILFQAISYQNDVKFFEDLYNKVNELDNSKQHPPDPSILLQYSCAQGNDDIAKLILTLPNVDSHLKYPYNPAKSLNILELSVFYLNFDLARYLFEKTDLVIESPHEILDRLNDANLHISIPDDLYQELIAILREFSIKK